jgi:hypothetical protein
MALAEGKAWSMPQSRQKPKQPFGFKSAVNIRSYFLLFMKIMGKRNIQSCSCAVKAI